MKDKNERINMDADDDSHLAVRGHRRQIFCLSQEIIEEDFVRNEIEFKWGERFFSGICCECYIFMRSSER